MVFAQWSAHNLLEPRLSPAREKGAILMIAMIMVAIITSIGISTLARVTSEAKSVQAGRRLLADRWSYNFSKLNTIVRNKQNLFDVIEDAPYLNPKLLDLASVGDTRVAINGLPVLYQEANITNITCSEDSDGKDYVIPSANRYIFSDVSGMDMFSVHNNTDDMLMPTPENKPTGCDDFPEYTDLKMPVFMAALSHPDNEGDEDSAIGNPYINPVIGGSLNEQPQNYWLNFIEGEEDLIADNEDIQELRYNESLLSMVGDVDAPWIIFDTVFDRIKVYWNEDSPEKIELIQFFDSGDNLITERRTTDPECEDCFYEWDCDGSEIISFDYWYIRLPEQPLPFDEIEVHDIDTYVPEPVTSELGYYLSGIGNVTCKNEDNLPDIIPNPNDLDDAEYLDDDRKDTWDTDGEVDLDEIGPRIRGIAGFGEYNIGAVYFESYSLDGLYDMDEGCWRWSNYLSFGTNATGVYADEPDFFVIDDFDRDMNYCVQELGVYSWYLDWMHMARSWILPLEQVKLDDGSYDYEYLYSGITCPKGSYIKEFKWMPLQLSGRYRADQYDPSIDKGSVRFGAPDDYSEFGDQYGLGSGIGAQIAMIKDIVCSDGTTLLRARYYDDLEDEYGYGKIGTAFLGGTYEVQFPYDEDAVNQSSYFQENEYLEGYGYADRNTSNLASTCPETFSEDGWFELWCDGEPVPPYSATQACLDRGFGTATAQDLLDGVSSSIHVIDNQKNECRGD